MNFMIAMKERRSIRSFKPDEVPQKVIQEVLDQARWTPSWGNTQCWEFYVVTGETLERFKVANRQQWINEAPFSPEVRMPGIPKVWSEPMRKRYMDLGKSVLTSLSIAREDNEARNRYYLEMVGLFGAPCLIVNCIRGNPSIEYAMLDIGLISQTICLLAYERGLGTCILSVSVAYPKCLRELVPIPENSIIAIGIALGYPDWNSPANHFERERAPLEELVTWAS